MLQRGLPGSCSRTKQAQIEPRSESITFRLAPITREKLEARAVRDKRSLSQVIAMILDEAVERD
jgi:predicted HicB family RNase H-like nuclease